jgi:hypothetical protein
VTVVDARGLLADESPHCLNQVALVSDRDCLGADSHIDFATDQATGHGVRVRTNVDRAAFANADPLLDVVGIESCFGQRAERQSLFGKPFSASGVGVIDDLPNERHVVVSAGEVGGAAKQERLIDTILEVSVLRFDITVLVGASGVRSLSDAAVVIHQRRVASRQSRAVGVVSNGRAERVGAMLNRHTTELPKRILNSLAECFEGFGETQRNGFDVAVRQHAVKERVLESRSGNLHVQRIANGEIACRESSRVVILRKENRLVGTVDRSPIGDPSLERSACRILELAGIPSL